MSQIRQDDTYEELIAGMELIKTNALRAEQTVFEHNNCSEARVLLLQLAANAEYYINLAKGIP